MDDLVKMNSTQGKSAMDWGMDAQRREFQEKYGGANLSNANTQRDLSDMDDRITFQFMKSLTSLQVLDNLVGQVDRHIGNYMVEELEADAKK